MKTYEIRLKPHCQRATDVERDHFTQEIPYGSACERCLGRVLVGVRFSGESIEMRASAGARLLSIIFYAVRIGARAGPGGPHRGLHDRHFQGVGPQCPLLWGGVCSINTVITFFVMRRAQVR